MADMDISDSIDHLERRFVERPANYLVEAELAFELKQILNDQLQPAGASTHQIINSIMN